MKVVVLGAGLVGAPMAIDLAKDDNFTVTAVDKNSKAFGRFSGHKVKTVAADLSDAAQVKKVIQDQDLVLSAVPGFMGFATLRTIIDCHKNVVDIAFFTEDPFELDELAKKNGVTALVDCGVAPGMSHILVGYVHGLLEQTERALILVGGLPAERRRPYEYQAVFSPVDVIEEYTRPARFIHAGKVVVRPALSDPEYIDFQGVGTLEAFNSDGLRTLLSTIKIPDMKEKTLRYPGHIEKMLMLRESGFFSQEPIDVCGATIRPIDLTAKLLVPMWQMKPGDVDITVMQVTISGFRSGRPVTYRYDLFDRACESTGTHSMARTTGYTATTALRMLAAGKYSRRGVIAPEMIGEDTACVEYILTGLRERGVLYRETVTNLRNT